MHSGGLDLAARVVEFVKISKDRSLNISCKVLDAACGEGTSAMFIAKCLGCNVIGIDFSAKLIKIAKNKARENLPKS